MPSRQRRRGFRLARDPRLLLIGATQIGLTATPKETKDVSNIHYFGEPVYTYTPEAGHRGRLPRAVQGRAHRYRQGPARLATAARARPTSYGQEIEDRIYNQSDMDRTLVLDQRTELVAQQDHRIPASAPIRFAKTIVFCEDIDHAERMRQALVNANADLRRAKTASTSCASPATTPRARRSWTTSSIPESRYPVIATTSKLLTTGVDAQTCKLIVLDQTIKSMTKFKQIIGRGTRINEDYGKFFFTIMDFKKATELFADPDFDGDPVRDLRTRTATTRPFRPMTNARQPRGRRRDPDATGWQATLPSRRGGEAHRNTSSAMSPSTSSPSASSTTARTAS